MPTPPKYLTHAGETLRVDAWAARAGVSVHTFRARIYKLGWSVAEAVATPPDRKFRGGRKRAVPAGVPKPVPELREHSSGQAVARWYAGGKEHCRYFGAWGGGEAADAYRRFAAEWLAEKGPPPAAGVFVAELILRFMAHVREYYGPSKQVASFVSGLAALNALYGDTPAAEFGPAQFRAFRQTLVAGGTMGRDTINAHGRRARQMFRWAASHGLIPAAVPGVLDLVEVLKAGRSGAREGEKVRPVAAADVEAVVPHLHPRPAVRAVLETLVRVHLLTGARSGELCGMTPARVDRSATPWLYAPRHHKTSHRGKVREILIGPRARDLLAPLWPDAADAPVFGYTRRTGGPRVGIPPALYAERVRKACVLAGVDPWHPHQLRHARATEVQRRYEDDDATAAAIGDTPEVARQVYTDGPARAVAKRIAEELG